jgi:hypothetical protein
MAKRETTYRRLRGTGRGLHLISKLWLGRDHLLLVESTGFSERYKRFYFADIEAMTIGKTARGMWNNVAIGLTVAILFFVGTQVSEPWGVFWWILAGVLLLFLIVNLALGPTSVCYLKTAVQNEKLTSLSRLRRARRTLNLLRPLITESQRTVRSNNVPAEKSSDTVAASTDIAGRADVEPTPGSTP